MPHIIFRPHQPPLPDPIPLDWDERPSWTSIPEAILLVIELTTLLQDSGFVPGFPVFRFHVNAHIKVLFADAFLSVMIDSSFFQLERQLFVDGSYSAVRLAVRLLWDMTERRCVASFSHPSFA